jgi:hypothetical protein
MSIQNPSSPVAPAAATAIAFVPSAVPAPGMALVGTTNGEVFVIDIPIKPAREACANSV